MEKAVGRASVGDAAGERSRVTGCHSSRSFKTMPTMPAMPMAKMVLEVFSSAPPQRSG